MTIHLGSKIRRWMFAAVAETTLIGSFLEKVAVVTPIGRDFALDEVCSFRLCPAFIGMTNAACRYKP